MWKNRQKKVLALICLVFLVSLLFGCGNTDNSHPKKIDSKLVIGHLGPGRVYKTLPAHIPAYWLGVMQGYRVLQDTSYLPRQAVAYLSKDALQLLSQGKFASPTFLVVTQVSNSSLNQDPHRMDSNLGPAAVDPGGLAANLYLARERRLVSVTVKEKQLLRKSLLQLHLHP